MDLRDNEPELRSMPHSKDAERAVLSCALQWPETIGHILSSHGGSRLFYVAHHRKIWAAIESLHAERSQIDLITLGEELRKTGALESIGGPLTLADLASDVPTRQLLPQYLAIVSDRAKRREIITDCWRVADSAFDAGSKVEDLAQELDTTTQRVFNSVSTRKARRWNQVILDTVEHIQARMKDGGEMPGLSYGIPALDEATNGMQAGQMIVVAARPGIGKTSLALNFGEHIAIQGHPVLIFSAEMLAEQLGLRSLSARSGIDSLRLSSGKISKSEFAKLGNAVASVANLPIYVDDRSDMRLIDIQVETRQLFREHGIKLVIVDYLQLLHYPADARNKEDAVSRLSKGLSYLAKELQIPIVVVSQLNRDSEKRAGGKPKNSDLRDSGQIEQDAHVILLLHAEDAPDDAAILDMELIVSKCRGGKLGPIDIEFHRPITKFKPKKQ